MNKYKTEYIDNCRDRIQVQLDAFDAVRASMAESKPSTGAFEHQFFNNMVLVLECSFIHRTRGLEGKDGNSLNEVRMLANSILQNGGIMTSDKTIKYLSSKSVLNIEIGDEISITRESFYRLSAAFFVEIRSRFS